MSQPRPFKWRHFAPDIIWLGGRWYVRYALSSRALEELMLERGLHVDHTTIYRWVQRDAPELERRCRPPLKAMTASWRVDATSVKVNGPWRYRDRAVDSAGNPLEFLLSPTRATQAAKRFFSKALIAAHTVTPRGITVEQNAASPKALKALTASRAVPLPGELRQVKSLNNRIAPEHRFIKRLVKPGLGFVSLETGWRTLQGYEVLSLLRKGQVQGVAKGDLRGQVIFFASLFGVAA